MNRPVRIVLNGVTVEIREADLTQSVLGYLREQQAFMGTKEGCAEGDCGACMVVVGELIGEQLQMRSINACIQFIHALDGKALFTIEYLRGVDGGLHPVQQAMVDCHGSQCGFCTPGFVMSLWNAYVDAESSGLRADRNQLASRLAGNLCRCTGYRTILDAAEAMFDQPPVRFDREGTIEQLRALRCDKAFQASHSGRHFFAPHSLAELLPLRAAYPEATLLAGCTDIGLWVNKHLKDLNSIISIGKVDELKQIHCSTAELRIGAGVALEDAYRAATQHYPELHEMWERFASRPIRHAGTLGGNIANGSPIGDSMPWLVALGATVQLASVQGSRSLPLESLYIDYMKKSMQANEIVEAVTVPLPTPDLVFRTYKVAKRYDSDISAVCAAFALWLDGRQIRQARIAYGGMAATPRRAHSCEAALTGANWDESTVQSAVSVLHDDFTPLSDMRASAAYRTLIAGNLLHRFYLECRMDKPLDATLTHVFSQTTESS